MPKSSDDENDWLMQYAIEEPQKDDWLEQFALDKKPTEQKKGIGKIAQALLGAAEGTPYAMIAKGLGKLAKGAARNVFAEEKESDLFNKMAYGLEMPELDQKAFEEQLSGLEKKVPNTPANIIESMGYDTNPQDFAEESLRGAGFGAALGGQGAAAKAIGAGVGAAVPQVIKALGLPPEAEEALGDMMDLTILAHQNMPKAPKVKAEPKKLPSAREQLSIADRIDPFEKAKPVVDLLEQKRMAEAAEMEKAAKGSIERQLDEIHAKKMEAYEKKKAAAEQAAYEKHLKEVEAQEKADRAAQIESNAKRFDAIVDEISPADANKSMLEEGRDLAKAVRDTADAEHQQINQLYDDAVADQSEIRQTRESLTAPLTDFIRSLADVPRETLPKGAAKAIDFARAVLGFASRGMEIGNDQLIRLEKSLNEIMQYDIKPHPTGVLQPLKKIISDEIRRSSTPEAYEKYRAAKDAYADWSERFQNEIVEPWRDRGNLRHDAMLKRTITSASDLEALARAVPPERILPVINKALKNKLSEAVKKGDRSAYDAGLKEFKDVLPEETRNILKELSPQAEGKSTAQSAPFSFSYPDAPPTRPTYKGSKRGAKYKKETPESVLKKAQTRSGLKALEEELGKNSPELKEVKESVAQQMLTNGKLPDNVTVEDFSRVLNDTQKRALLKELTSPEYVERLDKFVEEYKSTEAEIEESKAKESQKAAVRNILKETFITGLISFAGIEKIAYYAYKLNKIRKSFKKAEPKK